jgi:glutaredoxin
VKPVIVLYAKAGCHLCDEARTHLEDLSAEHGITFDEVDIRRDADLFERYRYRIPVITVDGIERLEGRIGPDEIRALVDDLQQRLA